MKKKLSFIKICSTFLAACFAFTFVACGGSSKKDSTQNNNGGGESKPVNTISPSTLGDVEGTVHIYNVTETNEYIVKNGVTEYKILVPQGGLDDEFINAAASDLRIFFAEATGIALETVEDSDALPAGKYLAIGETSVASAATLDVTEKELGKGGFKIKTVNDNVCMMGATNEASMYAVYAFLEQALGFELYYTDFYTLNQNVKELKLMNYDVVDIPDFEYRVQSTGWIRWNDQNIKRMAWTKSDNLIIPADDASATWHNTFNYLPPTQYKTEHPDWYAYPKANQLCYTAHGNEEEREQMLDIIAGRIQELFAMEKYKGWDWITVSIEDNQNCCSCETCAAEKAKYGADSAVIVKFCNDLAKRVTAWMQTEEGQPYYRENYRILFFAYHATNSAPVTYDAATDTYLPVDESVICDEHVAPYFAETNGDYTQNYHDENTANTIIGQNMKGWGVLCKDLYFWSYSTNFSHFVTPYNSFDAVQDILKFSKIEGCKYVMIQDQWIQANAQTGFGIFKNWLHSKLLWDVNANVEELTNEFFNAYFREAAPTMLQLFSEWRTWAKYQTDVLGYNGYRSVYYNAQDTKLWPQRMLEGWVALTEKAQEEIAAYKSTNPTLYNALYEHICIESISYRYLLIVLYLDKYSEEEAYAMKKAFATDVSRIGMTLINSTSGNTFASLFTSWGM